MVKSEAELFKCPNCGSKLVPRRFISDEAALACRREAANGKVRGICGNCPFPARLARPYAGRLAATLYTVPLHSDYREGYRRPSIQGRPQNQPARRLKWEAQRERR